MMHPPTPKSLTIIRPGNLSSVAGLRWGGVLGTGLYSNLETTRLYFNLQTSNLAPTHACKHTRSHTRAHARTYARTHARTHARAHAHARALTHAHAYAHTYIHTQMTEKSECGESPLISLLRRWDCAESPLLRRRGAGWILWVGTEERGGGIQRAAVLLEDNRSKRGCRVLSSHP